MPSFWPLSVPQRLVRLRRVAAAGVVVDVAPGERLAGLPLELAAQLPAAEEGVGEAAPVVADGAALAERQLGDGRERHPVRAIDGADAILEVLPRVQRRHLLAELRPRVGGHDHQAVGEALVEARQHAVVAVGAAVRLDAQPVEVRVRQEQPPPCDRAAAGARVVGEEPLERVGHRLREERLGRVVADHALRPVLLRDVVDRLDQRQVAAGLPEIGELDDDLAGQLALDADAVAVERRVAAFGRRTPCRGCHRGSCSGRGSSRRAAAASRSGPGWTGWRRTSGRCRWSPAPACCASSQSG